MAEEIILNEKQMQAFRHMQEGNNVFITGPGGTGKTTLIKEFVNNTPERNIAVTSTTGASALWIDGRTLHSYLGIGLGTDTIGNLYKKIKGNKALHNRWLNLDCLIIDEISMLSPDLFDKLEELACRIRYEQRSFFVKERELPFGGIQLVLSGDFCQLPVVGEDRFCFEAKKWKDCVHYTVYLDSIIRQENEVFQTILNNIRLGNVTTSATLELNKCVGRKLEVDGITPTKIYTTNNSVDIINNVELDKLGNDIYDYEMNVIKYAPMNARTIDRYKKDCIAPDLVSLCVDAQVMLLINLDLDAGLVNGSRGKVIRFVDNYPEVLFTNGVQMVIGPNLWQYHDDRKLKCLEIKQIPLRLAWAITVHKSQGMTIDLAEVDLSNLFTWNMAYVALSRVRSLDGLTIKKIDYEAIKVHPKAVEFYQGLEHEND